MVDLALEQRPAARVCNLAWELAPAMGALLALGARVANGPLTVDDAYITFRYARNIAEGVGFVYNPGEAVLGTTTPLWALVLASLKLLTGVDLPTLSMLLTAGLDALSVLVLVSLVQQLGGSRLVALSTGLLFAVAPMSVAYAAGGMEASLFVLLVGLSALSAVRGRLARAGLAAALATLTRPEGALWAALLLASAVWTRRRVPPGMLATYALALLPWALYATVTFGSPLPQSMAAKAHAYQASPLLNALALLLQPGLPGFSHFVLAAQPALALPLALTACALGLPLLVWGAVIGRSIILAALAGRAGRGDYGGRIRHAVLAALVAFAALYATAYALIGLRGVRMFHWYLVPLVPFYAALLALGLERVQRALAGTRLGWFPLLLLAAWWSLGYTVTSSLALAPAGFSLERERLYAAVARDYREKLGPETLVAAPEIGTLGYVSSARILDTVGLVSPEARRQPPLAPEQLASDNGVSPALILEQRPDYVVSLDQFIRRSLLPDLEFQRSYELVEARPAPIWESEQLLIFRLRSQTEVAP